MDAVREECGKMPCDKKAVDKDRKELTRKYMLDGVNTQIIT